MQKYIWLIKHLIWNHSKPKDNIFWIKCNEEDAKKMHKIMNGSVINVFGRNFHTSQTLYGSSIEIEFF